MNRVKLGLICGLVFGVIDVIPMYFANFNSVAMTGALFSRFAIGFLTCVVQLPWPHWFNGLLVGLLVSLPDAIITTAFIPILSTGSIGGLIIGWVAGRFGEARAATS